MKKGIILCGGEGTRLRPLTSITNKHLLPIYDKPMVLYPLETLKTLGIKDILLVSGGEHIGRFTEFLGDGRDFGVNLTYRVQRDAGGIAEALGLAKDFANGESVAVILGDNIFDNGEILKRILYHDGTMEVLNDGRTRLFVKKVEDASRFGVLIDGMKEVMPEVGWKIVEKPKGMKEGEAVTGLYIYPNKVFDIIPTLKPSARGELEVTDINNYFLSRPTNSSVVYRLEGFWSDAGTFESLLKSSNWAAKVTPQK